MSELSCISRGCCWDPLGKRIPKKRLAPLNVPYCYYPNNWTLYKYDNFSQVENNFSGFLKQTGDSFYGNDLPFIKVETYGIDDSILRLKMYDPLKKRYEPPWPVRSDPKPFSQRNPNAKYYLEVDNTKAGFKVSRASDGASM